jgi:hypothetical protein
LQKTVNRSRKTWASKLNDALWDYRTAYKNPMGMSPYKMVYGKACHLPLELEHKAYWAVKELNRDFKLAGKKRLLDLSSLDEWRSEAYENARLFKEKFKKWHDRRILKREFHVGEKVLLYRSRLRFSAGNLLSKWEGPFVIEEVYRSGAIKIASLKDDTTQVVNGQRLKHYISGDSYNEDIDIIQVVTLEEFIKRTNPGNCTVRFRIGNNFSKKNFTLNFSAYIFVVFIKYEKLRDGNG